MIKTQDIKDDTGKTIGVILDYNRFKKLKEMAEDHADSFAAEKAEKESKGWTNLNDLADELFLEE